MLLALKDLISNQLWLAQMVRLFAHTSCDLGFSPEFRNWWVIHKLHCKFSMKLVIPSSGRPERHERKSFKSGEDVLSVVN